MVSAKNDFLLSQCTIRLKDLESCACIGSGLLCYHESLKDKVYVITAAHNIYLDGDKFQMPRLMIGVEIWNAKANQYHQFEKVVNHKLVLADIDKDLAILMFEKYEIESLIETLPIVEVVKERHNAVQFVVKGFPNATGGKELATINPVWLQSMTKVEKFQLQLNEDYSSWATEGFSGSGAFINDSNKLYLFGVFTRYRESEKGKVIYCQYAYTVNEILEANYLPTIPFTFYTTQGLSSEFFQHQVNTAVKNLGPRYNEKINFRLPISLLFNDLAKDRVFKKRLQLAFDQWLTAKEHAYGINNKDVIAEIEEAFTEIKRSSFDWFCKIGWSASQTIYIATIVESVSKLNEKIERKIEQLYELQREKEKADADKKKDYSYRPPFESEISRMRELRSANNKFLGDLDNITIGLANSPYLLIQGEAGCGKSHLLGDIALERNKSGHPAFLLLGQLVKNGQSAWQNILTQLSLSCSKEDFLTALNDIGKQIGSRVLLLIDALNEGAGREIWPYELSGFIEDFKNYPFIGLALTVRSTYFEAIIPEHLRNDKSIIQVTHEGFKGNEYAALRLFAEHYNLEQPNFPILAPEFSNPLFLQLICQGVKDAGLKKFPQGFQGITALFDRYLKAVINNLIRRREEYRLRNNIIKAAVYKMAEACFREERTRTIPLQEALKLFDKEFPAYRHLLDDLLLENVFIQSVSRDYKADKEVEVIYFAYERLGDYYMADQLLKPYTLSTLVKEAFQPENPLGKLVEEAVWSNRGIMEVMAVLLPERFQLEIIEVYDWVFGKEHENLLGNIDEWLNMFLLDSLKWRRVESIDDSKIIKWLKSGTAHIDEHKWFNTLVEVTAQTGHSFNSDRLHRILLRFKMAERDSFWLQYLQFYSGKDDQGNGFPIRRLIDWAWQKGLSEKVDSETARLAGQTIAWVLSTSHIALRDQATKALVNLLEEQPDALLSILKAFNKIDDFYILERLYAVAYGCALRTSTEKALFKIAQHVYNAVFKEGEPPKHILLRDYARNTVEYAIYKGMKLKGDSKLIQPPYNSKMPTNIPSENEMDTFELNRDNEKYRQNNWHYHNQIKLSVMSWDFGHYTIESAFRDFSDFSFTSAEVYKGFLNGLSKNKRAAVKLLQTFSKHKSLYHQKKRTIVHWKGEEFYNDIIAGIERQIEQSFATVKALLSEEEYIIFCNTIQPQIENLERQKAGGLGEFYTEPIKRWIVRRVFELGYDVKMHGAYDSSVSNERTENKIERIGKKYQWIAFYETVAMVADNYWVKEDTWSNNTKLRIYPGPWLGHLRDIDPVFTKKNSNDDDDETFLDIPEAELKWWIDEQYNYWNRASSEWVNTAEDLPNPKNVIERKDYLNTDWLYLHASIRWAEPKPIGKDRYKVARKEIWYLLQAYLVKKKDKQKTLLWLEGKNFWGRWMPESHRVNLSLFHRENYWSLASKENSEERWVALESSKLKVMVTTSEAVGELSQDKSGAHFRYDMPCKLLFEGMKLQYGKEDGTFINENGEPIALNPDRRGILIRKEHLVKFLEENNLDIIWTILGEKNALSGNFTDYRENYFKVINGVYSLHENTLLSGQLTLANRE